MKLRLIAIAAGGVAWTFGQAKAQPAAGKPASGAEVAAVLPADAAWASYKRLGFSPDQIPKYSSGEAANAWLNANYRARAAAALWFFHAFPNDARRWQAAFDYTTLTLSFVTDSSEGEKAAATDMMQRLKTDAAVAPAIRERAWSVEAFQDLNACLKDGGENADLAGALRAIEAFSSRFPQSESLGTMEHWYVNALLRRDRAAGEAWVAKMLESPNPRIVEDARGWRRKWEVERGAEPVEIKFTAVDGRTVDLARLRGKVVMVDFWATWCGPCKEELPNVKAVYAKYHDQGFEIVGVALEYKEGDRQKLLDFVKGNDMPWPEYFDGQGWRTRLALEYSIKSVPSSFLLDRQGLMAAHDLRGADLDAKVKALLGP